MPTTSHNSRAGKTLEELAARDARAKATFMNKSPEYREALYKARSEKAKRWREGLTSEEREALRQKNIEGHTRSISPPTLTPEQEQWLTGFWEGDGTLSLLHYTQTPRMQITFVQKGTQLLDYIEQLLTFTNHLNLLEHGNSLVYSSTPVCKWLLSLFSKHLVVPLRQEQLALPCLLVKIPIPPLHTPTMNWLGGFWDAEGHSFNQQGNETTKRYLTIGISQKDPRVLESIKEFLGAGRVNRAGSNESQYSISNTQAMKLATNLLQVSHNQIKSDKLKQNLQELAFWNSLTKEDILKLQEQLNA